MIAKAGVVFASFFLLLATWGGEAAGQNRPEGELTIAFDASIAPRFSIPPRPRDSAHRSSSSMPCTTR